MIREATAADAAQICSIYNHYVSHTHVTFEEDPVSVDAMRQRMERPGSSVPWLLWAEGPEVLGYAYARRWHERSAYRHSVESTIYLRADSVGRRIGSRLYESLLAKLRAQDVHAVLGCIALPNLASVALHERLGFTPVGHFRELGWKLDRWIDVGYWQLLL